MLRGGGGVTGPKTTGGVGAGARTAGGAVVVGVATALRGSLVVVLGGGAVVVGAAVVGVGAAVVVVVNDVVVDEAAIGSSVAATCIASGLVRPAGEAPVQVETPMTAAARSGFATTGLMAKRPTRIVGQHITGGVRGKAPSVGGDTASAQVRRSFGSIDGPLNAAARLREEIHKQRLFLFLPLNRDELGCAGCKRALASFPSKGSPRRFPEMTGSASSDSISASPEWGFSTPPRSSSSPWPGSGSTSGPAPLPSSCWCSSSSRSSAPRGASSSRSSARTGSRLGGLGGVPPTAAAGAAKGGRSA